MSTSKRTQSVRLEQFKRDPGKFVSLTSKGTSVRVVQGPGKPDVVFSVAREPKPLPAE